DRILTVAFSRDGKLAAGGSDGLIRIWDQGVSSEPLVFRGDTQIIYGLAFSPDGTLACAGRSGRIRLYNSTGGQDTMIFTSPPKSEAVAFSPDSRRLACSGRTADGLSLVEVWDMEANELLASYQGKGGTVGALAFGPLGQRLASADGNILRVHDLLRAADPPMALAGHSGRISAVAFHPGGSLIASASEDDTIRLWKPDGSIDRVLTDSNGVLCVAFSPDGRYLVSGGYGMVVKLWDLKSGTERSFTGHTGSIHSVAFSPDGKSVASAGKDKVIRAWDLADPSKPQVLEGSPVALTSVAFHKGGMRLA